MNSKGEIFSAEFSEVNVCCYLQNDKTLANLKASNISLYDVDSLSNTPSSCIAVLNAVISLSNLSRLELYLPERSRAKQALSRSNEVIMSAKAERVRKQNNIIICSK